MAEGLLPIIIAIITLLIGLAIGWFVGTRPVAALRAEQQEADAEVKALNERLLTELRGMEALKQNAERADALSKQVETLRQEREQIGQDNARLKADAANHEKQVAQLSQQREELVRQFGNVGNKLLEEAREKFLERANERFSQSEEKSEERIKALLHPVGAKLTAYEQQIERVEKQRNEAYGDLKGLMDQMRVGQDNVRQETARLVNSLRNAPKARGRWGEQQLRNVLETCGLAEHTDFVMEQSIATEEGHLRPDAVVRIPGGRSLIVDAKVSLNDYQDAFEAEDELARSVAMERHCKSMKSHINNLGNKAYQTQLGDTPDYVIMFVPGEHFLAAALEHDSTLWDFAFAKKVLLATPTNLVAIARTVASVWQQEGLAANAREIAELGKEMHERLAKAGEDLKKVGMNLNRAVTAYNSFTNSFESRLMVTGRKFEKLDVETGKRDLEPLQEIESLPRYGDEKPGETD